MRVKSRRFENSGVKSRGVKSRGVKSRGVKSRGVKSRIPEIIADKGMPFSLNFTPKSIKFGEVMESEPHIVEPKTTYGL